MIQQGINQLLTMGAIISKFSKDLASNSPEPTKPIETPKQNVEPQPEPKIQKVNAWTANKKAAEVIQNRIDAKKRTKKFINAPSKSSEYLNISKEMI